MIKINYIYKGKLSGIWYEDYIIFYDVKKALRFLYGTRDKYIIQSWECDNPEDNNYLNYRFKERR